MPPVPSPIAERRIELVSLLRGRAADVLRLDPSRLRFSIGVSAADMKVPYEVHPEVLALFAQAARQLGLLLLSRHRELLLADQFDRYVQMPEFSALPPFKPSLLPSTGGPEVRAAAELGPYLHPLLTGGVMVAWLGQGGGGRSLVALLLEVLRRAFTEMQEARGREETPALVALMLSTALPGLERSVRSLAMPPSLDRMVTAASAVGIFLALRLAIDRTVRDLKVPPELALKLEAVLGPAPLLGGVKGHLTSHSSFYGCELSAGVPDADAIVSGTADLPVAEVQAHLEKVLGLDEDVSRRAEQAVGLAAIREALVRTVMLLEASGSSWALTHLLVDLATRPAMLMALVADEKSRKQLWKDLEGQCHELSEFTADAARALAQALRGYSSKEPAGAAGLSRQDARARYAQVATAALCDLWLDRALTPARRALDARTGSEGEGGLDAEYQMGRLYRISASAEPLLHSTVMPMQGHLFVDLKDFTRRSALLGEATAPDFLKRELFTPLLNAARAFQDSGVTLNHLRADALSMSGRVEALVALALDFRKHLAAYGARLSRLVPHESVARAVRAIDEEHEKKLQASRPGARPRLEKEREAALAWARGERLEAGIFISHGPMPLLVTIEDEMFGRARLAIADRLNESARGTARSLGAREKADALLAAERARRDKEDLEHPWSVFVGAPLSLHVPLAAEVAARRALEAGDFIGAMMQLAEPVKEALEETARLGGPAGGDIYNAGIALSEEAMMAFQEAGANARRFIQREVKPEELHPEIRERFFFPPEPLRLTLSYNRAGKLSEVFRYAGRAAFKDMERSGGIGVYELVDEAGVGAMLAEHHGASWRS